MSKRTVFTTITALPPGITRASVLQTLHSHVEMIDLNPLVIDRYKCKPPPFASAEEYHATWYQLTDRISYLPGGAVTGKVSYNACFHDLATGLQTHVYAPLGVNIKNKWTVGGSLPGEPREAVELGLGMPKEGLWLREDVDMRCNIMTTMFVRKTLKRAHATLVERLVEKAHLLEASAANDRLRYSMVSGASSLSGSTSPGMPSSASFAEAPGHSTYFHGHPAAGQYSPHTSYQSFESFHSGSTLQSPPYQHNPAYAGVNPYNKYPPGYAGHPAFAPQEVHGESKLPNNGPRLPDEPVEMEG